MTEEKEATKDMAADVALVTGAFNNAESILLEFDKRKYKAEVTEMSVEKFIVFKVSGVDHGLIDLPRNYGNLKARVFTPQGRVLIFSMRIIQIKLPMIVFAFPERAEPGFARTSKRLFVRQSVLMVLRKKDNPSAFSTAKGMGILTDLSPGGGNVMSKMNLSLKDIVVVYVNVSDTKEADNLELTGIVRRESAGDDGYVDFGLEWTGLTDEQRDKIKKFLEG
jgi:hypothetical protein